jgi:transposase
MDGTLVDPFPAFELADLSDLVRELHSEVRELRQEVVDLRRDNFDLRKEVGYWKSMHARAVQRERKLEAEVEQLRGENRKLQNQLFGQRSEKDLPEDCSHRLDGEDPDQTSSEPARRGQRKDRPGPKRRDYTHLSVVEEVRELPEDQRACDRCGARFAPSDTEDSEQIEIEVRPYRRRIRRRRYRRTCTCPTGPRTLTAAPAPKLIPKGSLGVSVWVEILLDKYSSHRPTERLLAHWRWLELDVAAGTVADGLRRLEPLFRPLHQALLERNARSAFAQADETRWMVFIAREAKTGYQWWLWVFLGPGTVIDRLDPGRSHEVPEGHFPADASVVMMVDRYAAYKAMAQVKTGAVILAYCWAHVRWDFVKVGKGWETSKPWALTWLRQIRVLYRRPSERRRHEAGSAAFAAADADVRQAVAAMQAQAETERADPKLPTHCCKVLVSLLEHWTGLTRFVDDLRIPLDNNASERQVRGAALGRKNDSGSGALWSGPRTAALFSLFASLTRAEINIRKWLTWYLRSCATNGGRAPSDIEPFLPWNLSDEKGRELAIQSDDSS